MNAKQKKEVAKLVKQAKSEDWTREVIRALESSTEDTGRLEIIWAAERELSTWAYDQEIAYNALGDEVLAVEDANRNAYLWDRNVDAENVSASERAYTYWYEMLRAAHSAIGFRAGEAGIDINAELGRVIF